MWAFARASLGEHLWTPGLAHGSIGPHEAKAGPLSQEAVHVGIADVIVGLGLELRLHIREAVLQRREVDGAVMALTMSMVMMPGGSPASSVPSMSKLISFPMHELPMSARPGTPS